ncbi:MAG: RHS repeat-associated core domain-containing protein [Planctomycetaceae bacterium]
MFTGVKRYNDLAGTQIVANSTYTYDLLGRFTALDHKNAAGTSLANYTWTFDNDGRITNFTNIDGYSTYTYDANDQVTVVDHSYQTDETYTYDANGNRTNTGYTTGTNNRVTSDGTYNYTYDDEGNRISRTKISDSTKVEYTWDHRNRLTDVVFKNASGTVTKKVQYQYDVFDRRIGKKIDATGDGMYESATYWVYDDAGKRDPNTGTRLDDIVLEFIDADGDGSGLATLSTRYLHGPGVDQILASEATSGNVVTWALADHQGTVRDMVRYASGTTTVVNHRKYDAFGTVTSESDATVKFLYSYTGREWDGDAGLYYYRARWYDAKIGRFILEDPMGFTAGDTNLSRYVGNSSPNATDPSGLQDPQPGYDPITLIERMRPMIDATGLNHPDLRNDVLTRDSGGVDGFDCDDVADIAQRYLRLHLPDANVNIITAHYTYAIEPRPGGGVNSGHAMVIVEYQRQYWLLNPLGNHISEPVDSLELIRRYAEDHIRNAYGPDPDLPVRISDLYRNHSDLNAGTPWHEDPAMRNRYHEFLISQELQNTGGLFPPEYDILYPGFEPPLPFWEDLWIRWGTAAQGGW